MQMKLIKTQLTTKLAVRSNESQKLFDRAFKELSNGI